MSRLRSRWDLTRLALGFAWGQSQLTLKVKINRLLRTLLRPSSRFANSGQSLRVLCLVWGVVLQRLLKVRSDIGSAGLNHAGTDAGKNQSGQYHRQPFKAFLAGGRGDGERHAKDQAGDEPSQMAPVINARQRCAKCQVEDDEKDHAADDLPFLEAGYSHVTELNSGENGSGDAEDSARCSYFQMCGVNGGAEQSSTHAGEHIDGKGYPTAEEAF